VAVSGGIATGIGNYRRGGVAAGEPVLASRWPEGRFTLLMSSKFKLEFAYEETAFEVVVDRSQRVAWFGGRPCGHSQRFRLIDRVHT